MGIRDGGAYISGLKTHPRDVRVGGRKVTDVAADPAFQRPVSAMAMLYDLQCRDDLRAKMTYRDAESGEECGFSFMPARNRDDLVWRREAMQVWADATFGQMGRSPDFLNSALLAWTEASEFFAEGGARFADNLQAYFRHCRKNDLFLTHAIVNPSVDRSKSSSQQADPYAHLAVVEETRDGLIVRGAKMLATHGPTADEILVYPLPNSLRPGEERYALAFGIANDAPGLRFISREPFDTSDQSLWDHPLGGRFEEPDAMVIFDDVLVPWERVFLYGDVARGNALFPRTKLQGHTGHQTAVRGLVKCRLMVALAIVLTRSVKGDTAVNIQEQLGECIGYLHLIEGAILLSEDKAEPTGKGTVRPALEPLQALRYHIPRFYERMVHVTQMLGSGWLLSNPTEADLRSEAGADIDRYYRGADVDAGRKIRLSKLAWDATGTQFGQRQLQYERFYGGDPVRAGALIYLAQDHSRLLDMIERLLALPTE
jgi:4-hydroxyphenylacetate 3-monooxygenase oxygenase component